MFEIFVTGLKSIFVTKLANFAGLCKNLLLTRWGKRYGTVPPRMFHLFTGVKFPPPYLDDTVVLYYGEEVMLSYRRAVARIVSAISSKEEHKIEREKKGAVSFVYIDKLLTS